LLHDEFHWDTPDHPPYSPDLAPSDFYLFLKMKEHLAGKRFTDDEDLQHAVVDWLNSQVAAWYEEGISKLVSRHKCLNVQGDYVEKQVKVCDKTCIFCFFPIINTYLCMAKRYLLS
jgi:histone-lysine N-methyltransferase SETMAR